MSRALKPLLSSEVQNYGTPRDFFAWVHWCFRFTVDACAEDWNHKLRRYWTIQDNGLAQSWRREVAWNNCEYDDVVKWLRHAKHEARMGGVSVNLVAARPDTRWWREAVEADAGRLVRSTFVQETRVWWLLWRELVVGFYNHDERLVFDVPEGTINDKGQPVETTSAPFPSSLIFFAARERVRLAKFQPARALRFHRPTGRPDLTWGMPG